MRGGSAALLRTLLPLEHVKTRSHTLHLSAISRIPFSFRPQPLGVTSETAEGYVELIGQSLSSIFAGERASEIDLATPKEVRSNPRPPR